MKKTLTTSAAAEMLKADKNANWSSAGAMALVEYMEEMERDTGEETEFDAVALRCEFAEYDSALDAAADYGFDGDNEDALDWLRARTTVIEFDGGVIVQAF